MPVLPLEPFLVPDDLLDDDFRLALQDGRWWVLHTRPRAEKVLARHLARRGAAFFLPLYERRYRHQRRLIRSHLPLFPGYLFLHGTDDERVAALETNLVVNVLHVRDQERLTADLRRVLGMIRSGMSVAPEERLQPGMPAEIVRGPLRGYRGTIVRRSDGSVVKFIIEVELLQRGVSVELDASMIQKL